jgi:dUTP pyrophosphatase
MDTIRYSRIREVKQPKRGTPQSAGIDFFIPEDWNEGNPYELKGGERVLIPSGLKLSIPSGHALIAFNKSGIASRKGLIVGACVVDEDYQGEVHINLINTNSAEQSEVILPGEKITQFILVPVNYADVAETDLENLYAETTQRGEGGFGSTGTR